MTPGFFNTAVSGKLSLGMILALAGLFATIAVDSWMGDGRGARSSSASRILGQFRRSESIRYCTLYARGCQYCLPPEKSQQMRDLMHWLCRETGRPVPAPSREADYCLWFTLPEETDSRYSVTVFDREKTVAIYQNRVLIVRLAVSAETHKRIIDTFLAVQQNMELFVDNLTHPDVHIRRNAIEVMRAGFRCSKAALLALHVCFHDADPQVRIQSSTLVFRHSADSEALATLIADCNRADPDVKFAALEGLLSSGRRLPAQVREISLKALKDPDARLREKGVQLLGMMGRDAVVCLPDVLSKLNDTNCWVRAAAARALGLMGVNHQVVVPALLRATDDDESRVTGEAIEALSVFGKDAARAIPTLSKFLQITEFRITAAKAILKIDPTNAEARDILAESPDLQ